MRGWNFAPRLANITVDKLDDNVKKWLNAEFSARFFFVFQVFDAQFRSHWFCQLMVLDQQHGLHGADFLRTRTHKPWMELWHLCHSFCNRRDTFRTFPRFWFYLPSDLIWKNYEKKSSLYIIAEILNPEWLKLAILLKVISFYLKRGGNAPSSQGLLWREPGRRADCNPQRLWRQIKKKFPFGWWTTQFLDIFWTVETGWVCVFFCCCCLLFGRESPRFKSHGISPTKKIPWWPCC